MSGAGTTTETLSVDVTQSGFLGPVGPAYAVGAANGTYASATGAMAFTGDVQGTNLPTLTFPFPNTIPPKYFGSTPPIPVTLPSGFELSIHLTFNFSQNPSFGIDFPASVMVTAIPEPASIVMFLTGMSLPLTIVLGSIRRRVA